MIMRLKYTSNLCKTVLLSVIIYCLCHAKVFGGEDYTDFAIRMMGADNEKFAYILFLEATPEEQEIIEKTLGLINRVRKFSSSKKEDHAGDTNNFNKKICALDSNDATDIAFDETDGKKKKPEVKPRPKITLVEGVHSSGNDLNDPIYQVINKDAPIAVPISEIFNEYANVRYPDPDNTSIKSSESTASIKSKQLRSSVYASEIWPAALQKLQEEDPLDPEEQPAGENQEEQPADKNDQKTKLENALMAELQLRRKRAEKEAEIKNACEHIREELGVDRQYTKEPGGMQKFLNARATERKKENIYEDIEQYQPTAITVTTPPPLPAKKAPPLPTKVLVPSKKAGTTTPANQSGTLDNEQTMPADAPKIPPKPKSKRPGIKIKKENDDPSIASGNISQNEPVSSEPPPLPPRDPDMMSPTTNKSDPIASDENTLSAPVILPKKPDTLPSTANTSNPVTPTENTPGEFAPVAAPLLPKDDILPSTANTSNPVTPTETAPGESVSEETQQQTLQDLFNEFAALEQICDEVLNKQQSASQEEYMPENESIPSPPPSDHESSETKSEVLSFVNPEQISDTLALPDIEYVPALPEQFEQVSVAQQTLPVEIKKWEEEKFSLQQLVQSVEAGNLQFPENIGKKEIALLQTLIIKVLEGVYNRMPDD